MLHPGHFIPNNFSIDCLLYLYDSVLIINPSHKMWYKNPVYGDFTIMNPHILHNHILFSYNSSGNLNHNQFKNIPHINMPIIENMQPVPVNNQNQYLLVTQTKNIVRGTEIKIFRGISDCFIATSFFHFFLAKTRKRLEKK